MRRALAIHLQEQGYPLLATVVTESAANSLKEASIFPSCWTIISR